MGSILWIRKKIKGKWKEAEIGYELTLDMAEKGTWVYGVGGSVASGRRKKWRTGKTILRPSCHLDFQILRSLFMVCAHTQTNFQFACNNFNCFRKTFFKCKYRNAVFKISVIKLHLHLAISKIRYIILKFIFQKFVNYHYNHFSTAG